jgi:hypothetical protein
MRLQIPFSVLDLSSLRLGETPREALQQKVDLARRVEALGFKRFWLAEHHGVLNACWGVSSKKLPGNTMPIFLRDAVLAKCGISAMRIAGNSLRHRSEAGAKSGPRQAQAQGSDGESEIDPDLSVY